MRQDSFISKLARHIRSHYDLTKQELTVVFPNKRAAFYLRNAFKENGQETLWTPTTISIEEAVTQWSRMTLVDNIDLLFELIDIDTQLHVAQSSDLGAFGSQAAQMAKDFDEIDQYDIDAQHLFKYVTENKKLEIWNFDETKNKEKELKYLKFFASLYDYYVRLRESLKAKNQGYYGLITKELSHLPEEELGKRIGEGNVIFAGFNALTTTEERIIDKLVKMGKAEVLFDYDRYYVDDTNNEAGLFARRYLATHPDWMKNGISDRLSQEEKYIHIISASGNTLQTKALQEKLQESDTSEQAVILADENLLIPVLNAIPATETYKDFKVSMGYPIKKVPINQLITHCFSLRRRNKIIRKTMENGVEHTVAGWYLWPILNAMDCELVKIIFTRNELAVFDQWKAKAVRDGKFIFESQDIDSLKDAIDIQVFLRLLISDNAHQEPRLVLQEIIQLLEFISNKIQSQNKDGRLSFQLNQVNEARETINRIAQVMEQHAGYCNSIDDLEILYKLLNADASIKLNSNSTNGLQIMGLLETRNIDFARLHVLSVNEGILPADKSQSSFIPHFIKRECGLPGYAEKQAIFAYHFYRLLQNGTDIFLYYNNLDESSGGEASRYILQIKYELARHPNIHVTETSFHNDTPTSAKVNGITALKDNALDRLHYLLQQKGLSPSALSTYLACPLKYYLKYIQQIEDSTLEEAVGANVVGTITHDTLEFLFEDYLPQDGRTQIIDKELFDKVILPKWEDKLAQSIKKNMPCGFPDVGFNYLNKITIRQQLKNYLQYTSNQLKHNNLTILKTEGELRVSLSTPFGKCRFTGRTDRIDRWGDIIRVIDYKTGRVESADLKVPVRQATDSDLCFLKSIPEKALQLLLYKYMYLKENPETAANQVEASIHGLRYANTIEFGLSHVKATKNDEAVPFLEDNTFIADMEALLKAVVAKMLDTETPFAQTEDEKKCRNCDFKLICKR